MNYEEAPTTKKTYELVLLSPIFKKITNCKVSLVLFTVCTHRICRVDVRLLSNLIYKSGRKLRASSIVILLIV